MGDNNILAYICYGTAGITALLSLVPTAAAWKRKALGPGRRLPGPIIAALFGNAALFAFGWIKESQEAIWLNGCCGLVQLVNLGAYLVLCTSAERWGVLKRFVGAGAYLAVTVIVGLFYPVELFKLFCLASGLSAASVPIITTVYFTEAKTVDLLPKWTVSVVTIVNALLWVGRALLIWNIPMAVQNGAGALCSAWFLVLLFVWDQPQNDDYQRLPGDSDDEDQETSPRGAAAAARREDAMDGGGSGVKAEGSHNNSNLDDKNEHKSSGDASAFAHDQAKSADFTDRNDTENEETRHSLGKSSVGASASGSGHKDVAIDVEPDACGNGGAPNITLPASGSGHKHVAIDVEPEACGNGGAPNITLPASGSGHKHVAIDVEPEASGNGGAPSITSLASGSGHKDVAIDVEAGGNGGAPNKTSPARASGATPSACEGEIVVKENDPPVPSAATSPASEAKVAPAAATSPASEAKVAEADDPPAPAAAN